jgi:hypothetical protein
VESGDVERNPDTQAPAPPPSLRKPGETLPQDDNKDDRVGVMRPVQFPKQKQDDDSAQQPGGTQPAPTTAPASTNGSQTTPAVPASSSATPPASGSAQPASGDASQPVPAKPPQ